MIVLSLNVEHYLIRNTDTDSKEHSTLKRLLDERYEPNDRVVVVVMIIKQVL